MARATQTAERKRRTGLSATRPAAPKAHPQKASSKPRHARSSGGLPRDEVIVAEATRFFADCGFAGQTRELAKRLGVTQPALYKHFATKKDLIERVYQAVFLSRWRPEWEQLLDDRSRSPADRLKTFYKSYARIVVEYNWIRITMQAALAGDDLTRRYVTMVGERIVTRVCHAFREHAGKAPVPDDELTASDLQLVWDLQGCIIYLAIKQFVYGLKALQPLETSVDNIVRTFLAGVPNVLSD